MFDLARIHKDFPVLSRTVRDRSPVYLDAATSQKPKAMIELIGQIYGHEYARAQEGHTLSREATQPFEGTRAKIVELINAAQPLEIVIRRGDCPSDGNEEGAFVQRTPTIAERTNGTDRS